MPKRDIEAVCKDLDDVFSRLKSSDLSTGERTKLLRQLTDLFIEAERLPHSEPE